MKFQSIPNLTFFERRIDIVQTIDIWNSSKNWAMKWSVQGKKGMFTREVAGKHTAIFTLIENYPKISQYRSHSAV